MKTPSPRPSVPMLAALCSALVLLAACATAPDPAVAQVTSSPAPRVGPGPITAYDAYAFVLFSPEIEKEKAVAMASTDPVR